MNDPSGKKSCFPGHGILFRLSFGDSPGSQLTSSQRSYPKICRLPGTAESLGPAPAIPPDCALWTLLWALTAAIEHDKEELLLAYGSRELG